MNSGRLFVLDAKNSCILSLSTSGSDLRIIANQCGFPDGIAVDKRNNHIYWTNMGERGKGEEFYENDGSIERIDFDGSNRQTIIPKGSTFTPTQLQLDMVHGFIYWSDREGMRVMRANLDGSDVATLIQTGAGECDRKDEKRHCVGVAIDVANGHLYWTQKGPANGGRGRIFRAGLNLLPGMDPANRNDIEVLWRNLPEPVDLEIDQVNGNLYWTDRGDRPFGNTLNRSSVQRKGMAFREILCSGLKECIGLALDLKNDTVYFSDLGGNLYCSQLDGFNRRKLYSGDSMFTGIAYVAYGFDR